MIDQYRVPRRHVWIAILITVVWNASCCECRISRSKTRGGVISNELLRKHRLIVRYHIDRTAGGLANQLLCHIGAFLLAVPLRADVVLPSALSRDSFDVKWWQQEWHTRPLESLLDVERMITYWMKQGVTVHQALSALELSGNVAGAGKEPKTTKYEPSPDAIIDFKFEGQGLNLASVLAQARERFERHRREKPAWGYTILDLGVINSEHFPFNLTGCQELTKQVVRGLIFAPSIKHIARELVHKVSDFGNQQYNGLHLRFETDALSAWAWDDSAQQVLWDGYVDGMKRAGFTVERDMYIASGLDSSSTEFYELSARLKREGVCRDILHKDSFIPHNIVAGLHSEQKALLDLLVLVHASRYVGTLRSSFSGYVRDLRTLHKKPGNSSIVIKVGDFPSSILPFQKLVPI